ncbi:hypothetical protein TRIP_C20198 [Candidatus Zixiibacteriota bacterium]|nr:hypothetical protein TRIP_C20198 [candidate division Zixibacteria bacterium]
MSYKKPAYHQVEDEVTSFEAPILGIIILAIIIVTLTPGEAQ